MTTTRVLVLLVVTLGLSLASADAGNTVFGLRKLSEQTENQYTHPEPHPHPSGSSGGGNSGGGGGGSGGGGGGSGSGSSGGGGGSSGGGSSGSSEGSGGSSGGSGSSGEGESDGGHLAAGSFVRGDHASTARQGALVMIAAAAVLGAAIAAVVIRKRKVVVKDHPLKGALNRRIQLFSNLADHHDDAARPPRRYDEEKFYNAEYVLADGQQ